MDAATGGFEELIDLDGRAVPAVRRARVQARQVYTFATAGALGWDGPWRAVMERGLAYFRGSLAEAGRPVPHQGQRRRVAP